MSDLTDTQRVSNTIRAWLDTHYIAEDRPILDRIAEFALTTLVANGSELLSKQLLALVKRRVSCYRRSGS